MFFIVCRLLFATQVYWAVLGAGFRFLLPHYLPLQATYLALIVACNGRLYETLQVFFLRPELRSSPAFTLGPLVR